jgi:hypothetical protein
MHQPLQQSNFYTNLSRDLGPQTLQFYRKAEKLSNELSTWQNHLHFIMEAKRLNLCPPSLTLVTNVRGSQASQIIKTVQRRLLGVCIEQSHFTINAIRRDLQETRHAFDASAPPEIRAAADERLQFARQRTYNRIRERHYSKIQRLLQRKTPNRDHQHITNITKERTNEIEKQWVHNYSSKTLTIDHLDVLTKELAFTPIPARLPVCAFITAAETAVKAVGINSSAAVVLQASVTNTLQ